MNTSDHRPLYTDHRPVDKAIIVLLLAAVVFTALAHGAVEAWSRAVFEIIVAVLLLLWAIKWVADKRLEIKIPATLLPLMALFVAGLAQSVAIRDETGRRTGVSMDIEATRVTTTTIFFLLVCCLAAANLFLSAERLRALSKFLVVYGLALAVFALIQHFSWDGRFYWLRPTAQQSVFGPFVNRNHYAGYMEMLAPLPLAMLFGRGAGREARLFYGFAAVMMSLSVAVSLSRGGMISLAAGMMFVLIASVGRARRERHSQNRLSAILLAAVIAASILVGVVWIGADPIIDRIAQTISDSPHAETEHFSRGWIWRDSWSIFRAHPFAGAGLGAFETAYPLYGHGSGRLVVAQAHNDYLQLLTDAGIFGGLAALSFIALVIRSFMKAIKANDPRVRAIATGCGGGLFAMLIHSLFDFNLQLLSNALVFLFLTSVLSCIGAFAQTAPDVLNRKASLSPTAYVREMRS
ncbi:MAG: O-antigen ligase family protein [Acidobacteriota bacterium]